MQGGEEGVNGWVSPSQSNKVSLFRNIRHETEQSDRVSVVEHTAVEQREVWTGRWLCYTHYALGLGR